MAYEVKNVAASSSAQKESVLEKFQMVMLNAFGRM